jgi:hypothetical protein
VDELIDSIALADFNACRQTNDYVLQSYPPALQRPPAVPTHVGGLVNGENNLIFSKIDAEMLARIKDAGRTRTAPVAVIALTAERGSYVKCTTR